MRSFLWLNLVIAAAPRPSCMAWRLLTPAGSMNSSQPIMRCTYSSSISNGSLMRMEPCTQGEPRCRWRTSPSYETVTSGNSISSLGLLVVSGALLLARVFLITC